MHDGIRERGWWRIRIDGEEVGGMGILWWSRFAQAVSSFIRRIWYYGASGRTTLKPEGVPRCHSPSSVHQAPAC